MTLREEFEKETNKYFKNCVGRLAVELLRSEYIEWLESKRQADKDAVCNWSIEDPSDYDDSVSYTTECDHCFDTIDGRLEDNNFRYCFYCGKKIEVKP